MAEHHYRQVYDSFCVADSRPIAAFVTNETGGHSITNGWMAAAFPDLIALIDRETCLPVCSAQLQKGQQVSVVCIPKARLKLGRGMLLPELYAPCEKALGKKLL